MIVLDRQSYGDKIYIGIQKPNKTYTYLHWQINKIKSDRHHFTKSYALLEDLKDMYAIGPNTLVVWSSEDEDSLC